MPDTKVATANQVLEAFSDVPQSKQKKVRRFTTKFRRDATLANMNCEMSEGAADPKLRSVRIDDAYRGIVLKSESGNVYMLLWVDHHDGAYRWARNRVVQIHPDTGSLRVLPIEEGQVPVTNGEEGAPDTRTDAGRWNSIERCVDVPKWGLYSAALRTRTSKLQKTKENPQESKSLGAYD